MTLTIALGSHHHHSCSSHRHQSTACLHDEENTVTTDGRLLTLTVLAFFFSIKTQHLYCALWWVCVVNYTSYLGAAEKDSSTVDRVQGEYFKQKRAFLNVLQFSWNRTQYGNVWVAVSYIRIHAQTSIMHTCHKIPNNQTVDYNIHSRMSYLLLL